MLFKKWNTFTAKEDCNRSTCWEASGREITSKCDVQTEARIQVNPAVLVVESSFSQLHSGNVGRCIFVFQFYFVVIVLIYQFWTLYIKIITYLPSPVSTYQTAEVIYSTPPCLTMHPLPYWDKINQPKPCWDSCSNPAQALPQTLSRTTALKNMSTYYSSVKGFLSSNLMGTPNQWLSRL